MALITTGLTNGGVTTHFNFSFDGSFARSTTNPAGPEPDRTNAVMRACENDYTFLFNCFGGGINITGINVQVATQAADPCGYGPTGFGACWNGNQTSSTVRLIGSGLSYSNNPGYLRYLIISEVSEIFMMVLRDKGLNKGWFQGGNEGSKGEGLSLFLASRFLVQNGFLGIGIENDFAQANTWLKSARKNYIDTAPDDPKTSEVKGCTTLFIYYLFAQLGFTIHDIIAAGADTLAGVYRNLTGDTASPFPLFKHQLDIVYPGTSTITGPNLDNPYPIGEKILWHNSETNDIQFWFMHGPQIKGRNGVIDEQGDIVRIAAPWSIVGTGWD